MESAHLVANGDLRLSANQICEQAQTEMERKVVGALAREGVKVIRAYSYGPVKKHGFIDNHK